MSQILSYDEHDRRSNELPEPYVYRIQSGNGSLTYFGASHSNNPDHRQFPLLRTAWQEFLASSENGLRLAMVEGGTPIRRGDDERKAITQGGEGGLLALLADRDRVEVTSPEPSDEEIFKKIEAEFGVDAYLFYEMAHRVQAWYRRPDALPLREWAEWMLERHINQEPFLAKRGIELTYDRFVQMAGEYGAPGFGPEDIRWWDGIMNPVRAGHPMNAVTRAASILRDERIAATLIEEVERGRQVFAVYGRSHVFMQEPYLRHALAEASSGR